MKPLVCMPATWDFNAPIKKSILCHNIGEQNVSKWSEFEVNPCAHNCTEVCFQYCNFYQFPSATSIIEHCPQINMLLIQDSKLSRIEAEDLKGFESLKELRIINCEIEHLPGDLFKFTPNLEIVCFYGNKIKSIDEDLLTIPLQSLKYFDLRNNPCIDYWFNSFKNQGTIKNLKAKLKEMKSYLQLRNEVVALKVNNGNLNSRCKKLEDQLKEARDEIKEARNENKETCESIETLKKQVQQMQEAAMNFVVKINGKEFKAQKQVLKAHSKVIEKLIDENPKNEVLELTELSEAVFVEILNFMHLGYPPNENVDLVELFSSSCRFEIEALTPIVARILQEKVNPVNALKVLVLCNKYKDHEQLKLKAFDEFKKHFPHFTINAELMSQPEKLKQILKAKLELDKLVK